VAGLLTRDTRLFVVYHPPALLLDGPSARDGVAGMGVGWSEDSLPGVRSDSALGIVGERPQRSSLECAWLLFVRTEREELLLAVASRAMISLRLSEETSERRDLRVPTSILTLALSRIFE
jgi:hypothetical protein